jgi:cation diffusion facilitator CzcD-associated flavoprotein CzcO
MDKEIIIVGTGFSGIGMAIQLKAAGFNDFVILEKANEIGGTWRDNTYPGAACDVKSHLYSFSFEPNPDWSRVFSGQKEILAYLKHCVIKYSLLPHIQFNWEMKGAAFQDNEQSWHVESTKGEILNARFLILGNGPLHLPNMPDIQGLTDFKGTVFHSARWNHAYDLKGKNVAVIGTGASAIQFVPEIVPLVNQLFLFQRTAPWVLPKPDGEISNRKKTLYRNFPFIRQLNRALIYVVNELSVLGFSLNKNILKYAERIAASYLKRKVKDEELRKKLTPTFHFGCKRVLLSNNYLQSLTKPNVSVITDPIAHISDAAIHTNNETHCIDAIICGTGFYVTNSFQFLNLKGKNGVALNDLWKDAPAAYLGCTVNEFPNLFMVIGPNTGLGHSSMVYMIESQVAYIIDGLKKARAKNIKTLEVKKAVQDKFNAQLQAESKNTIWISGCKSWYLTPSGVNAAIWPGFTFTFRQKTKTLRLDEYACST